MDDWKTLKQCKFLENIKENYVQKKNILVKFCLRTFSLNGKLIKVKNNIKNSRMSIADKTLLRKRSLIMTLNDELKNIIQLEHSRRCSFNIFIADSLSVIVAYCFFQKKPNIDKIFVNAGQQYIF